MLWQWSPYVIAEVAAAACIIVMAIYFPWRDLNRRTSLIGVTLLLACSQWMLAHAIEIGLPVPSYKSYLMGADQTIGSDKEIILERGGEQRTFNMSVSVAADPDGHSTSKVILFADITYRKKAEEERQQSAEQLLNALKATIECISKTTEIRDPYTAGHQNRGPNLPLL